MSSSTLFATVWLQRWQQNTSVCVCHYKLQLSYFTVFQSIEYCICKVYFLTPRKNVFNHTELGVILLRFSLTVCVCEQISVKYQELLLEFNHSFILPKPNNSD